MVPRDSVKQTFCMMVTGEILDFAFSLKNALIGIDKLNETYKEVDVGPEFHPTEYRSQGPT